MLSASMLCRLQKAGQKCAADIGRNAEFKAVHRKEDLFLIFRFRGKLDFDDGILWCRDHRQIRGWQSGYIWCRKFFCGNDLRQNLSFPAVIGREIQPMLFAPFFHAHAAGTAFHDPLLPYGHFLAILDVVDCHGSHLHLHAFAPLAQIRTNSYYH